MRLLKERLMAKSDIAGTIFKIKRFSIHDGPGIRTSVFLKGCPLNCVWCHSPEGLSPDITIWHDNSLCIACGQCVGACPNSALQLIKNSDPIINIDRTACTLSGNCVNECPTGALQFTGFEISLHDILTDLEKDILYYKKSIGGITLTGGEPLYQPDFSLEILKACKQNNIHTAIESCLFCDNEIIHRLSEFLDLFIIDMKIFDQSRHLQFTGKSNEIIKENFRYIAKSGKEILVRIPMIKGITDTEDNLKAIEEFVYGINKKIPIEHISYNPLAENNYKRLGMPFLLKNETP
jgi:pyruvate formate lyase activating enzyme